MSDKEENSGTNALIGIIVGLAVVYFAVKYLGIWIGYIMLILGLSHLIYDFFKKKFTKLTILNASVFFGLAISSFAFNYFINYSDCDCYEAYYESLTAERGVDDIDYDVIKECREKWKKEVFEGNYKSNNNGVYTDPIQYFEEKCDDKK